jgi:type IV pilus assembly protein PilM
MAKIQAVWAIDIGQAALKALKLVPGETAEEVTAEAFDFVEYPKILSQPDADPEELVREALATFIGRNELKGSRVAIAVPGQAGLVKFIKLPPVEKKRIPDIVKFEARQQIPFALDEVIWDYQQIGGEDAGDGDDGFTMAEVGLFAMKRDQINRAILPFRVAGIEVDIVQMGPISLYNFAAYDKPRAKEGETGSVVLLDVGADNTDLIITDGTRIWQRNVPIGGNHFTRALTKELKLTFAKAEHLKRNATKAPDPRAVFTAMRGVFNDFSSEISRSIGFYSSVNRTAKILKVIGLGNGFKLPGLQKFLQQNLSFDVERLETFEHLKGDDVVNAPQFQENMMSFAVAYGLGVQGLAKAPLRTNLLPPEIEQTRMIRRKKPWALAASVLGMLGFSAMFIADWRAWAKVTSDDFKSATSRATSVASTGAKYKTDYEAEKGKFNSKLEEGNSLVDTSSEQTNWASLLATLNAALPNPERELKLDPNDPFNVGILHMLRVHIDAVLPRYLMKVDEEWFNALDPQRIDQSMHAFDRANPPKGEGWVIQVVGHHYNPSSIGAQAKRLSDQEKKVAVGPINYLTHFVVPRLWTPAMRQYGISHAVLAWAEIDHDWVTTKLASEGSLPKAPLIARAGGTAGGAGGMGGMQGMMMGGMKGEGGPMAGKMGAAMGGYGARGMDMMKQMMGSGMPGMMGGVAPKEQEKIEESKITRTNFMIQFLWQPPAPGGTPEKVEDIAKKLKEAQDKAKGAIPYLDPAEEEKISVASKQATQKKLDEQEEKLKALSTPPPPGTTPGAAPAAPGAAPGAPAAAPSTPAPPNPPATTPPPADKAGGSPKAG